MQKGVAERDGATGQRQQPAREGEPGTGAVDDGLDGEAHTERQRGHGDEVQQSPGQGSELAAQLIPEEPPQESGTGARVRHTRVGIRKVLDLHDG